MIKTYICTLQLVFLIISTIILSLYRIAQYWLRQGSWRFICGYQAQAWIIVAWACTFILAIFFSTPADDITLMSDAIEKAGKFAFLKIFLKLDFLILIIGWFIVLIASVALFCLTLHYCAVQFGEEKSTEHEEHSDCDYENGLDSDVSDEECDICTYSIPPRFNRILKCSTTEERPQDTNTEPLLAYKENI